MTQGFIEKFETASGVGGSGITFLASATASASANVEFTSDIDSTYNVYMFVWQDIVPQTDAQYFRLLTSTDGGVSYDNTAADYWYGPTGTTSSDDLVLHNSTLGTGSNETSSGSIFMYAPSASTFTMFTGAQAGLNSGAGSNFNQTMGARRAASNVDAVQFSFRSGNIASGTIKLYGLVTPS